MYLSAEGAQAQSQRLETIANNLANVNTPGFKRDVASFQARFAEAILQGEDQPDTGTINQLGGGVMVADVKSDWSTGAIKQTAINTDMAIVGEGFFKVQAPTGETLLTRAGNFMLNRLGELVTQDGGYHVLDASDAPVSVLEGEPWNVTADGYIQQFGAATPLAVVAPTNYEELAKIGGNMFRAVGEVVPLDAGQRNVRQGYLEMSSVSPTLEMMSLIESSRAFEANTQLIQNQDHMLGSLISRVLQA